MKPRELHLLLALREGPSHGYALMQTVERESGGEVRVGPATLYRTLDRMEADGWIARLEAPDPDDERRVRYELTSAGRGALRGELDRLRALLARADGGSTSA